jgi:hypothetical protein
MVENRNRFLGKDNFLELVDTEKIRELEDSRNSRFELDKVQRRMFWQIAD